MEDTDLPAASQALRQQVQRVIVGHDTTLDLMLTALLCNGHVLLEGVPGLAKTLLAKTFSQAVQLEFRRIQFTPDLMPGDIIGTNLFHFQTNTFTLTRGPIFTQVLLADEVNRTPPKTQAALLQAMQERQITIDGITHELSPGFFVIATQNPSEHEGTYPLPEAQLDRFLFKIRLAYPSRDEERRIVAAHSNIAMPSSPPHIAPTFNLAQLQRFRLTAHNVRVSDTINDYIVDLMRATREHQYIATGASPRAGAALASAARAYAALAGRDFVLPDDIKTLALPALRHRIVLAPAAHMEGVDEAAVVQLIIDNVAAPR